jgi:hypothetical protein
MYGTLQYYWQGDSDEIGVILSRILGTGVLCPATNLDNYFIAQYM